MNAALNAALQTVKALAEDNARLRAELARTRALFIICDEQRRAMIRAQHNPQGSTTRRAA